MKNISADIRDMFRSPALYVCIAVTVYVLLLSIKEYLFTGLATEMNFSALELITDMFASSGFTPFAVVICLLPYSTIFCDEYRSSAARYAIVRTSRRAYAVGKIVSVCLSGVVVMTVAASVVFAVAFAIGSRSPDASVPDWFINAPQWAKYGQNRQWGAIAGYKIIFAALFGGVWALAGLLCSAVFLDRFVGLVVPFAIYQGLWGLLDKSPFNPVRLLRGDATQIQSVGFVIGVQSCAILLLGIASFLVINRRCRYV